MEYKRIIIEKQNNVNPEAENLLNEFKNYLGIHSLLSVRVLNVYDLINATENSAEEIINKLLFDPNVDFLYKDSVTLNDREKAFRIEYHRGQFNQREDSTKEMISKYLNLEDVDVHHSKVIVLKNASDKELEKIKSYYINPTECKEVELNSFHYEIEKDAVKKIEIMSDFVNMSESQIRDMKDRIGLGMDTDDLLFCQKHFQDEKRDPSIIELKIIDTYWSDHCRHTTFMTQINDVKFEDGKYKEIFEKDYDEYLSSRKFVYGEDDRPICLMDLATINMKETKKKGLLNDKEETDEINAASIEIDVDVDGKDEKYLLMFKNETHNHPTEIEPFGGAATCLGGGIRDPLSGRALVYQAMRITGSADPRQSFDATLEGKLPQRKITQTAMEGYSSYGNQIGATSGYINEFYDEDFVAKRLELGALVAAAPKSSVFRGKSEPTDLVLLLGGRTGRDGLGAAVGSSKVQTKDSLETAGAEVQKGNPKLERKIVRLFRNPEATRMIKKCNDFGAGGVAVAVGELADGLLIDLDKVPVKYSLNAEEIALSESQERMAVVISKDNLEAFMKLVEREDLEGTVIAEVTDKNRLQMKSNGEIIVDIDRKFLDTNGIRKENKAYILSPQTGFYLNENSVHAEDQDITKAFVDNLSDLNIASQKGLIERFDNTIGSGTVLAQSGGKYKLTPQEGMVAKIPVLNGNTNTCSIFTCGYDPKLGKWSTFHGGYYAVIESIAKIVALGGDYRKIRLTFQEYFERLGDNPNKWGKPFASLLGAFVVQKNLDLPSIGGKDSMSGSFGELNVPPSLFSFAVSTEKSENIVSKEFKKANSNVIIINLNIDDMGLVDFNQLKENYTRIKELVDKGYILSASSIKYGGIARNIAEMSFGNAIGFKFSKDILDRIFKPLYGSIILEIENGKDIEKLFEGIDYDLVGTTIEEEKIIINNETIGLKELIAKWENTLNDVFPINRDSKQVLIQPYNKGKNARSKYKFAKPRVLIPIFTGTHGEYDMAKSFINAGAEVETFVFKSLNKKWVETSFKELSKKIKNCQILGLPNGQIYGDEPEGSGKLIKIVFSNPYVKESLDELLNVRDGLILGIGEGLAGLLRLGLIDASPFLTYNISGGFLSDFADIEVISNLSPWMNCMEVGEIYTSPLATKEGRIILGKNADKLIENGQVATAFYKSNPTGSEMAVESLTGNDGRILGTVASIERLDKNIYKNIDLKGTHKIFKSGVKYFD